MLHLRTATNTDHDEIQKLYLNTFPVDEKHLVAALAIDLLNDETYPETISMIAELDGKIVGHVAFSPVQLEGNADWKGYTLAPLAVLPEYQKQQIGSKLVETGISELKESGIDMILVYGDPEYYGRFGFEADLATQHKVPYKLQYPFGWLAMYLSNNTLNEAGGTLVFVKALNDQNLW